jgi:hypothetical protein
VSARDLVAPANVHSRDNHLCRIGAHGLGPLLYVNLDAHAVPLAVALGTLAPRLGELLTGRDVAGELTTDYACNWKTYVEHCLASRRFGAPGEDGVWLWQWPLVMAEQAGDVVHVQQIVPRTFSRSRVIEYVCAANDAHANAALETVRLRAQADKSASEALQRQREAGEGGDEHAFAAFHRAMHEVHAQSPRLAPLPLQQGVA